MPNARDTAPHAAIRLAADRVRTADGVELFIRDWGAGPPIVFVASWSLTSDSWAYQMAALSEAGLRCVAYDRRGHGRSADPGTGFDFDTLADDLAAVLDALDLTGAVLVGHSMGPGEIVRYLTRHGSGRVAGAVMLGTITPRLAGGAGNPDGPDPATFEAFRSDSLLRDFPRWLDENVGPFLTPETSPGMMDWIKAMSRQASLKALLDCHRAISAADFAGELSALTVPVLIVHGDRDVTCPLALAHRTAALVPDATLAVYEGAPHGLFLTHMDRFNRDLLDFARGTAMRRATAPSGATP